jgi:tetratricopeptide (TPR) repeat protein
MFQRCPQSPGGRRIAGRTPAASGRAYHVSMANMRSRKLPNSSARQVQKPHSATRSTPVPHPVALDFAGWAAIFLAVLIAYTPALHGSRIWDDAGHITRPDLQSLQGLWRIWFHLGATQQYYPLLHSAFWIEHRLWGDSTVGYHLVNFALHALSACLVVAIVRRLGWPGAWLSGFLFALHPVCVEAVAWISEQKSTLSTVFYLAAALIYLSFDRTRRATAYWAAFLLFILALLSKTVTATLPAAILLILWFRRGRLNWRLDVLPLVPWAAIGLAAGIFTAYVENRYIGARGAPFSLTAIQRMLLAGRAICFYLMKLVYPVNLIFVYPRWTISPSVWWQYLFPAGVLVVGAALVALARRSRGPLTAFLYFIGTLFPALGFLNVYPFRYSWVADHFQYLASLGILVGASVGISLLLSRWTRSELVKVAIPAILCLVLGGLAWRQSGFFDSDETLFAETLAHNPDSSMAQNNLGVELARQPGQQTAAITHFEAALRADPDSAEAHENLGLALSKQPGGLPDAIAHLEAAERLQPDYPESHLNLGSVLARVPSRVSDAIAEYETALRLKPDFEEAHLDLGTALASNPARINEAIQQYRAAIAIDPGSAQAHYSLANLLARTPDGVNAAIAEYQSALQINPRYVEARTNLATVVAALPGRASEAVREYQAALEIDPASVEAHYDLALLLTRLPGRMDEAIAELDAVLRIRPDLAQAQQMLERLRKTRNSERSQPGGASK